MSESLRKWIKKKGMTQSEFATTVGCSDTMANYLLRGRNTDVRISMIRKLHLATGIPMGRLINELLSYVDGTTEPRYKRRDRAGPSVAPDIHFD